MARVADALWPQHLQRCHPEYLHIEPEAPVVHIPHIRLELLLPSKAVAAIHLRPAGDAGLDLMAAPLERGVSVQVLREQRPRTHQTHVSLEHVPELWQLIETGAAKPPSQRSDPLPVGQEFSSFFADVRHPAEFIE